MLNVFETPFEFSLTYTLGIKLEYEILVSDLDITLRYYNSFILKEETTSNERRRPSNTHSTLKQISIPSFQENLVPKMKYIHSALKFGTQSRSNS